MRKLAWLLVPMFLASCAGKQVNQPTTQPQSPVVNQPSAPVETPAETPAPSVPSKSQPAAALWWNNSAKPERNAWASFMYDQIAAQLPVFNKASDATKFCPKYASLTDAQKITVWVQMFVATAYYESAWSPVSRMKETTLGTDNLTGQPVYSEGLLQLSYGDIQVGKWKPYCAFDWAKDKNLSATDPKKTILDPYINLRCGIGIMAEQIKAKGAVMLSSGVYWSTLKVGGKYNQIAGITARTKQLSFCQ